MPACAEAQRREVVAARAHREPTDREPPYDPNEGSPVRNQRRSRRLIQQEERNAETIPIANDSASNDDSDREASDDESAGNEADQEAMESGSDDDSTDYGMEEEDSSTDGNMDQDDMEQTPINTEMLTKF